MLKKTILIFLIFGIAKGNMLLAQTFTGKIYDSKTKELLPYVSISVEGTNIGTISNSHGVFKLKVPETIKSKKLNFSFIGYKSQKITINESTTQLNVYLESAIINIEEVTIRPDSNIYTLLRGAYKRIEKNYPVQPTLLTGFYRESFKWNDTYLYLAEAVIEGYKTSYKNTQIGQVKILKSRINSIEHTDSLYNFRFVGGLNSIHTRDVIHNRKNFINPSHFKEYDYTYQGMVSYNDGLAFKIRFDTKNDSLAGSCKGIFYIDEKSLAYVFFDVEFSERGIKERKRENLLYPCLEYKYRVYYKKFDEKWGLLALIKNEKLLNLRNKKTINMMLEYVTNNVRYDSVKPIPYTEQIQAMEAFSEKATTYDESTWKDYNIIEESISNQEQLKLQFSNDESTKVLTSKFKKQTNSFDLIFKYVSKLKVVYGIYYHDYNFNNQSVGIEYKSILLNKNITGKQNIGFHTSISFDMSKQLSLYYTNNENISKQLYLNTHSLGIRYLWCLKPGGKQFFALPGVAYYTLYSGYLIGSYDITNELTVNEKTFKKGELNIYTGQHQQGVELSLGLKTRITNFFHFFINGSYYVPLQTNNKLLFENNKNFLVSQKAYLKYTDSNLMYYEDGEQKHESAYRLSNWNVSAGIRVEF